MLGAPFPTYNHFAVTIVGSLILYDNVSMQRFKGKVGGIKVQVVDTTGAGDAFCAGLLSNLAKDFSIIEVSTWFSTVIAAFTSVVYFF